MSENERDRVERDDEREVRSHARLRGAVFTLLFGMLVLQIMIPYAAAWWAGRSLAASVERMLEPTPR